MSIFVEIVRYDGDEVVRHFGPYASGSAADRVEDGANINLDHENFYTRQVTE